MKKKIFCLFLTLGLMFSFCGCRYKAGEQIADEYFTVIKSDDLGWTEDFAIVYANDTKVMYVLYRSGYGLGMSPLYNADGSIKIYDGR